MAQSNCSYFLNRATVDQLRLATELSNPNARWDYVKYQIRQFSLKLSKEKANKEKLNELVLKVELKNLKVQYTQNLTMP